MNLTQKIILSIWNGLFSIIGTAGNFLVIYIIWKNKDLHFGTNYFLGSLSIADGMATCIAQPLYVMSFYYKMPVSLSIVQRLSAWISISASVIHLFAIAIDRLVAICSPLRYTVWTTTSRVQHSLALIWVVSVGLGVSSTFSEFVRNNFAHYFVFVVIIVVTIIYGKIFLVARQHRRRILSEQKHINSRIPRFKDYTAAKTTSIVVGSFIICWLPGVLLEFFLKHDLNKLHESVYWVNTLTLCSSSLNPYIYFLRSKRFRRATKAIFKRFYKEEVQEVDYFEQYYCSGVRIG